VNTPKFSIAAASMMSPVSNIRRASTGPVDGRTCADCPGRGRGTGWPHADAGIPRNHGDVHHQRHLETAAQRKPTDLADSHLREAHQIVVETE
jgi:hypothetical protein